MFERNKKPFAPGLILVLAALLIGLIWFLNKATSSRNAPAQSQKPMKERLPADWFFAMREYPTFRTDLSTYDGLIQIAAMHAQKRSIWPGFSAPWTTQGPANIGARINTIAVHPSNPNTIYIGYSAGGVWKTTNGGQNWVPIFDQRNYMAIGSIAIDPSNPNTIYVGTGDLNISGYPFIGDGLWKSTDGGQTWQHLGLEQTRIISKVIVHPTDSKKLYVATMGQPFARDSHRGLYVSTNGGVSWQKTLYVNEQCGVIDLEIDPQSPNILYASVWNRIRNNQESLVVGNDARIWKSLDGGLNWQMLTNGLPLEPKSRIGIAIDQLNPQRLMAVYTGADLNLDEVFVSNDRGVSWNPLPYTNLDKSIHGGFGWYFGKMHINPFNPNNIWVLGVTSQTSMDGGITWSEGAGWSNDVHADHHDMIFVNATTALLATDGGLYKTTDGGVSWNKIENIPTTQFYRTAYNPHNPDFYYGGTQDNGTITGNAAGLTQWSRLYGGDGFQAAFHPTNPKIFYYEWQNGNIVGSTDGIWVENATQGIDDFDRRHWDMQYFISPNDPNVMLTGTYRVYRGKGHLPLWEPVSPDLTDGVIYGERFHTISTIAESPLSAGLVYVGTNDGNVWEGDPGTQIWNNRTAGLPERYVSSVKPSPTMPNRVFVTHTGYKDGNNTPLIHRSENRGQTWTSISGDMPNFAVNDIAILPGHQDTVIFAATDVGVYGTRNGGLHWERLGIGMPFIAIYDLEFNVQKKELVAASFGRSLLSFPLDSLKLGLDVSTFDPFAANQPVLRAYPSLFAQDCTIDLDRLRTGVPTELIVVHGSGQIMLREVVQNQSSKQVSLNTTGWPPGMYYVSVRTAGALWAHQKLIKI